MFGRCCSIQPFNVTGNNNGAVMDLGPASLIYFGAVIKSLSMITVKTEHISWTRSGMGQILTF